MPTDHYSTDQRTVLKTIAIFAASMSIVAGSLMSYWFWKLKRRTFRHQLIMLLVMSDTFRALFQLIYPAATIASKSDVSNNFCTSMGFLVSLFVDASDFAVLIIALNTALFIFFPRSAGPGQVDEGVLYRFRHTVYASWAIYSIVLASLAFLNVDRAYTTSIAWCYLPIRPFYWRIALSWGPRYFILVFIILTYVAVFIHVRRKFSSFGVLFGDDSLTVDNSSQEVVPMTLEDSPASPGPKFAVAELKTHNLLRPSVNSRSSSHATTPATPTTPTSPLSPGTNHAVSLHQTVASRQMLAARRQSYFSLTLPSRASSRRPSVAETGLPHDSFVSSESDGTKLADATVSELQSPAQSLRLERARIISQMRHLFIYPVVYLLMWTIPFVYHMTQYSDTAVKKPSFPLACCSAFMVPVHGLVDVLVYARNEKPWRSWRYQSSAQQRNIRGSAMHRQGSGIESAALTGDARPLSGATATYDPTDVVSQRHQQEILEAEWRRSQRSRLRPESAARKDWWDLEEEELEKEVPEPARSADDQV